MRGPRRFCSLAFQFLMRPLSSGASASSRIVCIAIPRKGFIVTGSPPVERRKKHQAPRTKLQKSSKNKAPTPATLERHHDVELGILLETGFRSLLFQLGRPG